MFSSRSKNRKRRKINKSSPRVENSPKKTKQYKSPQQLQLESQSERSTDSETELKTVGEFEDSFISGSQTIPDSPDSPGIITTPTTSTTSSRIAMQSPDPSQSQSQSLLGGPAQYEPYMGQSQSQHDIQSSNQPHFLNPVMLGPPMNPGMVSYQGLPHGAMPPGCPLSDQDILKIGAVLKQLVIEDVKKLVTAKVESATQYLKTELKSVQDRCTNLEKEVCALKVKNDDIEQYSRRMCLRIAGIQEREGENVTQRVLDFADNINVNINGDDIDRAHRVGRRTSSGGATNGDENEQGATSGQSREIIIKFTNSSARLKLLQGRTKLRDNNINNIYINEDLTPARKELAYECRKLKRTRHSKVEKTWVYAGYPHIVDKSGNKVKITCMSDLDEYRPEGTHTPSQPMTS